jgi:hypothetical protein
MVTRFRQDEGQLGQLQCQTTKLYLFHVFYCLVNQQSCKPKISAFCETVTRFILNLSPTVAGLSVQAVIISHRWKHGSPLSMHVKAKSKPSYLTEI